MGRARALRQSRGMRLRPFDKLRAGRTSGTGADGRGQARERIAPAMMGMLGATGREAGRVGPSRGSRQAGGACRGWPGLVPGGSVARASSPWLIVSCTQAGSLVPPIGAGGASSAPTEGRGTPGGSRRAFLCRRGILAPSCPRYHTSSSAEALRQETGGRGIRLRFLLRKSYGGQA